MRSPLTALVETTPSLSALPPNIRIIVPSMPSNLTCPLSRVLTSASTGGGRQGEQSAGDGAGPAHVRPERIRRSHFWGLLWGAHRSYTWPRGNAECGPPFCLGRHSETVELRMRTCALLLMSSLAMSIQAPNKTIVTVGTAPASPYSHAVKSGGLIYLSGAISQDASGNVTAKGDIKGQTRHTIERLRTVLTAAGSSLDQVVAVTVYLKSASDFAAMNEVYSGFWTKDPPTRTTVVADARPARRARRDFHDRRAHRRRAGGHPPSQLDQVAESLQLRDSHRRHAVSLGAGLAQRARQHRRDRRHQRADRRPSSTTRPRSSKPPACRSTTSSARVSTCPTARRSSR